MEENARVWKIIPVMTGSFGMVRDDIKYEGGNPKISGYVPSVLFLLESEGEQVIVDTGFGEEEQCREKLGLSFKREKPLNQILLEAGIERKSIAHVILTHLHWDHIGNMSMFPNAWYYCQKKEWIHVRDNREEHTVEWFNYLWKQEKKMILVENHEIFTVLPGIKLQWVGGHTVGSQIVIVQTKEGKAVITGDTVMTYKNIQNKIPVGLCTNKEECKKALNMIEKMEPAFIYPSHDFAVFGRREEMWEF